MTLRVPTFLLLKVPTGEPLTVTLSLPSGSKLALPVRVATVVPSYTLLTAV